MKFLKSLFGKKERIPKVDIKQRFEVVGRVGQGSMSKVWRAIDSLTGKTVALKVLDLEKTKRFESRFVGLNKPTEGEIAIQLRHPNIVRTLEAGITTKGEQYLVMEFVEGVGLSYLVEMQNQKMQENRLRFIIEIGEALNYIHKKGWIHRDICPRNVLLDSDYNSKLIDFGLMVPDTENFRKPGNRTGTATHMAPELIKRQRTDQRIDIFSYAVSCYEMYTSRLPWDRIGVSLETVMQHINRPPDDIRELTPDIDERIAETIMRGLKPDPYHRWSSTAEMLRIFKLARKRLEGVEDESYDYAEEEISLTAGFDQFAEQIGIVFEPAHSPQDKNISDWTPDEPSNQEDEYEDLDKHFEIDDDDDDDDEYETV